MRSLGIIASDERLFETVTIISDLPQGRTQIIPLLIVCRILQFESPQLREKSFTCADGALYPFLFDNEFVKRFPRFELWVQEELVNSSNDFGAQRRIIFGRS